MGDKSVRCVGVVGYDLVRSGRQRHDARRDSRRGSAECDELEQWRDLYRKQAERAGGGVVSVEIRQTARRNVLETIVKQPRGLGFDVESTLVIPNGSRTFTISEVGFLLMPEVCI